MSRPKGSKNKPKMEVSMAGEPYLPLQEISVIPSGKQKPIHIKQNFRIQGWINIQHNTINTKSTTFYAGGDIHPTIESAKAAASHNTVTQIYVTCEAKV